MSKSFGKSECLWYHRGGALIPADPVTEEILAAIPAGKWVTTSEPRSRRNPKQHRFAMAVLHHVIENSDEFADIGDLMFHLKMRCRMFREVKDWNGRPVLIPRSTSFAAMGQEEFNRLWKKWAYIITSEIIPGLDIDALFGEADEKIRENA